MILAYQTSLSPPSLSDSAVKQILLTLDERPGQSFIIEDLDEFHVLIRADEEQRVRRELEAEVRPHPDVVSFLPFLSYAQLEKNTYSMEALVLTRVADITKDNHLFRLPTHASPVIVINSCVGASYQEWYPRNEGANARSSHQTMMCSAQSI
jgi:TFIIH basal transcription factor complex TTD-A subunit